ncbi:aaa family ATPase [Grosmannia clavigera kw1407]|uniref:Aaa family ATPase n=1 Tax=Grosmannia clavigera (strain kw1407 / UAMH 11150) TaxID=655863 RepID=F0XUD6_GROCL|nr:aaa family ATPase [Grosmannia clavigera kw1407]EFW98650.1 aaa family ATPase [Grosmannia clavigera kw1407]
MADKNLAGTAVQPGIERTTIDAELSVSDAIHKGAEVGLVDPAELPVAIQKDSDGEGHEDGHDRAELVSSKGKDGTQDHGLDDRMLEMRLRDGLESDIQIELREMGIILRNNGRKPHTEGKKDDKDTLKDDGPQVEEDDTFRTEGDAGLPPAKPGFYRVIWKYFSTLCMKTDSNSFAIDVLEGEPILAMEPPFVPPAKKTANSQVLRALQTKDSSIPGKAPLPERIRFHSKQLAGIIDMLYPGSEAIQYDTILLRPYRILVYLDEPLRAWHRMLQSKFGRQAKTLSCARRAEEGGATEASIAHNETSDGNKDNAKKPPSTESDDVDERDRDEMMMMDLEDSATSFAALRHLEVLIEFMDTDIAQKISYLKSADCQHVTFSDIWYLFEPGSLVIGFHPLYYSGPTITAMGEVESQVVVDFEAAFTVDDHAMSDWRPKVVSIVGDVMLAPEDEFSQQRTRLEVENIADDLLVDWRRQHAYMKYVLAKSGMELLSVAIFPRPIDKTDPSKGLTEEDMAIMSYRVFGFVLRNRKWAQLDLMYLNEKLPSKFGNGDKSCHDNDIASNTFDRLVLPNGHADIILGLVDQHFRNKQLAGNRGNYTDIVRGKGNGLIILLHGAPGVGKTTTAEGVAEKFNKPLFQITCGDLGTTAKDVEKALDMNFALASRWGCVLLLDEADVFLAHRTKEDFVRNGFVAVFLRVLEYYSGILFLTTNRVGDFDEAFASRIHISLYYPELDLQKTNQVFILNLELVRARFAARDRIIESDDVEIGSFIRQYWDDNPFERLNGRQIRNACQTAVALAEYDANGKCPMVAADLNQPVKLKVLHFKKVADAYLEFSRYVRDIYGTHAARRTKEAGLRAMWVDNKGNVVGNIGPKGSKRTRYQRAAMGKEPVQQFPPHGSYNPNPYYQQQQQQQQQQQHQQRPQYLRPQTWADHGQNKGHQGPVTQQMPDSMGLHSHSCIMALVRLKIMLPVPISATKAEAGTRSNKQVTMRQSSGLFRCDSQGNSGLLGNMTSLVVVLDICIKMIPGRNFVRRRIRGRR